MLTAEQVHEVMAECGVEGYRKDDYMGSILLEIVRDALMRQREVDWADLWMKKFAGLLISEAERKMLILINCAQDAMAQTERRALRPH